MEKKIKQTPILRLFLSDGHQLVVFNGHSANWLHNQTGVLQGSILGLLLFLVYINNLSDG